VRTIACAAMLLASSAQAALTGYNLGSFRLALIDDPIQVRFQESTAPNSERFRQAVSFITTQRDWRIATESGARFVLVREVRDKHLVRIEVTYDPRGYRLRYLESANLLYEEQERFGTTLRVIHRNYNKWMKELTSGINVAAGVASKPLIGTMPLQDVEAVPFLKEEGRRAYTAFLASPLPRAFAIAPSGAFGFGVPPAQVSYRDGFDVLQSAMDTCRKNAGGPCKLFAIDDRVVWSEP
jgi:hypothetical protein